MTAEEKLAEILRMLDQHDSLERDEVEISTHIGWVSLRDFIQDN